jgi:3-hydroxyacyl-CoA dehydrogenase
MGPLALNDLIGTDVVLHIMNILYQETGDSKYRPNVLLKRWSEAASWAEKTGKGFLNILKNGRELLWINDDRLEPWEDQGRDTLLVAAF